MRIHARGSLVISSLAVGLISSCSLAPNGPTNRLRISLSGSSSQAKDAHKSSHLFAGLNAFERIQEMLGISALHAGGTLPYGFPTSAPFSVPATPTEFQCFGVNVTGPGILPPSSSAGVLPADSCVPSSMPGSGIYGGLVYSALGGEIDVDGPSGPDRIVQVFGIQSDGSCPSLPEIISQPLGMHPFQYAYELGRAQVDVLNDTTVTVSIHSNSSNAQRLFCDLSSSSTINRQWTKQLGVVSQDTAANGVAVDSSANIFITGVTSGGLDGNSVSGTQDFFVTKFNSSGVKQWTKQMGVGSQYAYANGVAVDSSGNIIVAGMTTGGLDGNTQTGTQDFFVTKYSSSGAKQWTRQMGVASEVTNAIGVTVDLSGNAFVVGRTAGGLDGQMLHGSTDLFFTKYDPNGLRQWTIQNGASGVTTEAAGIAVDSSSHVHVAGSVNGPLDGEAYLGVGYHDAFITKY